MSTDKSWKSFVAGATAGAIEGFVTYPFEFAKTRLQLIDKSSTTSRNPISLIYRIVKNDGVAAIYTGCIPAVMGNTAKAGVRFLGFDAIKDLLRDENGHLTKTRGAVAGLGAGVLESVLALTPSESIKTAFIDDRQRAQPRYNQGFVRGLSRMIADNGVGVFYRGLVPVTLRQASNQFVRLGSYNALKSLIQENRSDPTKPLTGTETFALGMVVGVITVYATMPVDTVKTRMQSIDARSHYKNTVDCFVKVAKHEGVLALWKGSTARLGRLVLSGGIVFTIYEKMMLLLN
ncbi:Tricarboxylate transport protein [Wickerhamiella sorbophila]|uniref:Tricarboxylate transport protein n=1 Tax=Wickerhamiella sorbophila TaxID=45607 RepID=A0A2T0FD55_9ASCO|nr:Tricarboxylate transport protein [Wickerhamiella sorbophila]PRT52943.1 Tricarboxylate transport protein [Wickerhamiella sorbophila]